LLRRPPQFVLCHDNFEPRDSRRLRGLRYSLEQPHHYGIGIKNPAPGTAAVRSPNSTERKLREARHQQEEYLIMSIMKETAGFHCGSEANPVRSDASIGDTVNQYRYTFEHFFHPFVGDLIQKLNQESLRGMLDPLFLAGLTLPLDFPTPTPAPI